MKNDLLLVVWFGLAVSAGAEEATKKASTESGVVTLGDIDWGALNPARGEKGPRAGNLWNDRTKQAASGFLVKFADGFSSPPHIHNVTYRGVVISGQVHNDDPEAAEMWMPPGSFWTQPAGEVHITAAKGKNVLAYIEIDSGPYLVLPKEKAEDLGERPVNLAPSNIVWLSASETTWIESPSDQTAAASPEMAFLWGKPGNETVSGSFVRLPTGFKGEIIPEGGTMHVVIVKGALTIGEAEKNTAKTLKPGEYSRLETGKTQQIDCADEHGCVVYVRALGKYRIKKP
ncbi:DUF4437 domain-containing protein [Verrucomicrobiaceae bacterium N1E253]|uniref:DUF4437 domain-containing protein n=1 Tax=Oceaniferula marina TaxID=2748318 RepID=A0A851GM23_9BACT|nr:DUF4437 domain-containing protein [Oceaniferula marina]NWK55840.1 DUF4437 domain-containing protein [Oceaniferula marina]